MSTWTYLGCGGTCSLEKQTCRRVTMPAACSLFSSSRYKKSCSWVLHPWMSHTGPKTRSGLAFSISSRWWRNPIKGATPVPGPIRTNGFSISEGILKYVFVRRKMGIYEQTVLRLSQAACSWINKSFTVISVNFNLPIDSDRSIGWSLIVWVILWIHPVATPFLAYDLPSSWGNSITLNTKEASPGFC